MYVLWRNKKSIIWIPLLSGDLAASFRNKDQINNLKTAGLLDFIQPVQEQ